MYLSTSRRSGLTGLAVYFPAVLLALLFAAGVHSVAQYAGPSDDPMRELYLVNSVMRTLFVATFLVIVLIRFPVRRRTTSGQGVLAAIGGTCALAPILSAPLTTTSPGLGVLAAVLVTVGSLWTIGSVAVLGKCFGILPDVRGLVTRGPYRLVRHPVYLGEIVAGLGILLPVFSVMTVVGFCAFVGLQIWRTHFEEAALSATFPEYNEYARRTRRLIPGVW